MSPVPGSQMGIFTINNSQFRLYEGLNTIGRNREAVVNIKHVTISQNHAIITILNGQYFISDIKSSNGTYLDDVRLVPLTLYPLSDSSKITLGNLPGSFSSTTTTSRTEASLADTLVPTQSFFDGCTQLLEHSVPQNVTFHEAATQEISWSDIQPKSPGFKALETVTLAELPPPAPLLSDIHDEHLPALDRIVNVVIEAAEEDEQEEADAKNTEQCPSSDDELTDCEENARTSEDEKQHSGQVEEATCCDKSNESLEFLNSDMSPVQGNSDTADNSSAHEDSFAFKRPRKSFMVISTQDLESEQFEDTIPATQEPSGVDLDESDLIAATQAAPARSESQFRSESSESEPFKLGLTQLMDQNDSLNMFSSPTRDVFSAPSQCKAMKSNEEDIYEAATQKTSLAGKVADFLEDDSFMQPTQKVDYDAPTQRVFGCATFVAESADDTFLAPTQKINFAPSVKDDDEDLFIAPTQKIVGDSRSQSFSGMSMQASNTEDLAVRSKKKFCFKRTACNLDASLSVLAETKSEDALERAQEVEAANVVEEGAKSFGTTAMRPQSEEAGNLISRESFEENSKSEEGPKAPQDAGEIDAESAQMDEAKNEQGQGLGTQGNSRSAEDVGNLQAKENCCTKSEDNTEVTLEIDSSTDNDPKPSNLEEEDTNRDEENREASKSSLESIENCHAKREDAEVNLDLVNNLVGASKIGLETVEGSKKKRQRRHEEALKRDETNVEASTTRQESAENCYAKSGDAEDKPKSTEHGAETSKINLETVARSKRTKQEEKTKRKSPSPKEDDTNQTRLNQSMALLKSKMTKTRKAVQTEKIQFSFAKDRKSMELAVAEKESPEDLQTEPPKRKRGRKEKVAPESEQAKVRSSRRQKPLEAPPVTKVTRGRKRGGSEVSPDTVLGSSSEIRVMKMQKLNTSSPDRPQRKQRYKVAFTMMDSPQIESLIKQLGGSIVDSVESCHVLIAQQVKRSQKLLSAIGLGRPICTPQWIIDSKTAKQFLDPWDYILSDPEAEQKWDFSLKDSLERGKAQNLLNTYHFYIQAASGVEALKGAIQSCGGKCVSRVQSAPLEHAYVISSAENRSKYCKIVEKHSYLRVIDAEAVFDAVLRQEIRFSRHYLT